MATEQYWIGVDAAGNVGVRVDEEWRPVSADGAPLAYAQLMSDWDRWFPAAEAAAEGASGGTPIASVDLNAPVLEATNIICALTNYGDKTDRPDWPLLFFKARSAVPKPGEPLRIPSGAEKVDWEGELVAVIKDDTFRVSVDQALDHVAAYTVMNEVTDRGVPRWGRNQVPDWYTSKSQPTFALLSPWLRPATFIEDPQDLHLELSVNGQVKQSGSTEGMIFSVAEIVSYASQVVPLRGGDLISTGTPAGMGIQLGEFLNPGDQVRLEVSGVGVLEHGVE
jgi:2-keto-4-pentenoate hydratase/2-oxohepta-3-ene-1,7-dioic acid hydratase in catechol pathway